MARPGPRHAEPEKLTVDGAADHGCNGLPLCADCQRQRPEPVKQDMPGFAAPPTGPNQVGKLASANTRPPTTRLGDSPALPTAPQSTSAAGIDRRKAGTTQSQGSSSPRPGAWSTVCGWCASPIPTPAKPSRPLWSPTTKGRSASNTASPPPQPRHTRVKTRTTDPEPRPRAAHPELRHERFCRRQGRKALDAVSRPTQALAQNRCSKIRCGVANFVVGVVFGVRVGAVWPCADALCVHVREGGPVAGPPCGVQAAVSYSPTPWRVQYHRRWQS